MDVAAVGGLENGPKAKPTVIWLPVRTIGANPMPLVVTDGEEKLPRW